jgi:hypothetical protein
MTSHARALENARDHRLKPMLLERMLLGLGMDCVLQFFVEEGFEGV